MSTFNIKQFGHKFSVANSSVRSIVAQLYHAKVLSPDNITDEAKAEFIAGSVLAYADTHPEVNKVYGFIDGNYVALDADAQKKHKGEKLNLSIGFVMAESQQKFGALRNSNPALHALMKPVRDAVNKYTSNSWNSMLKMLVEIDNEAKGKTITRKATKSFDETITDTFDSLRKKIINAKARGDDTANEAKFREALVAFNTVWNHK